MAVEFEKIISPDEAYRKSEDMHNSIRLINTAIQAGERKITITGNLPKDFKQRLIAYVESHGWHFLDYDPDSDQDQTNKIIDQINYQTFYLKERNYTFPESWRKSFPWLNNF